MRFGIDPRTGLSDDPPVTLLRDPVWRGSLVVLLRHYTAYAVALAFGSAALAVSVLSGRPFLDAADVALVRDRLDAVPATASADDQGRVRAAVTDGSPPRVENAVTVGHGRADGWRSDPGDPPAGRLPQPASRSSRRTP